MNSPPPQQQSPPQPTPPPPHHPPPPPHPPPPAAEPTAVAVASAVAADAARIFDEEVRSAVSYERGLALKALLALGLVRLGGPGPRPRGGPPPPAIPRWTPP